MTIAIDLDYEAMMTVEVNSGPDMRSLGENETLHGILKRAKWQLQKIPDEHKRVFVDPSYLEKVINSALDSLLSAELRLVGLILAIERDEVYGA